MLLGFRRSARRSVALALGSLLLFSVGCRHPVSKNVAATVNDRAISYSELDHAMAVQFSNQAAKATPEQVTQVRLQTLQALIDDEILLQKAEKEGLLASDADVDAKFSEWKAPYTQEQFHKLLAARKMTVSDLKARIRRELSVQKLTNKEIGSHISISDTEVKAFYDANKASFNLPENKVRLAQILVTPKPDPAVNNLKNDKAQNEKQAKAKIQMLEMRIREGEDFGQLAQNYSEDQFAANGGDVGFVPESALDRANAELRQDILAMTPGQVSPVLHTSDGYRIIKLISKEPAGQRQLSDPRVQEEIRQGLFQAKEQVLRAAFYEVARSQTKVVNYYAESVLASRDKK